MDSAWTVAFAWLCALARDTGRHLNFYKSAASVQPRRTCIFNRGLQCQSVLTRSHAVRPGLTCIATRVWP